MKKQTFLIAKSNIDPPLWNQVLEIMFKMYSSSEYTSHDESEQKNPGIKTMYSQNLEAQFLWYKFCFVSFQAVRK